MKFATRSYSVPAFAWLALLGTVLLFACERERPRPAGDDDTADDDDDTGSDPDVPETDFCEPVTGWPAEWSERSGRSWT